MSPMAVSASTSQRLLHRAVVAPVLQGRRTGPPRPPGGAHALPSASLLHTGLPHRRRHQTRTCPPTPDQPPNPELGAVARHRPCRIIERNRGRTGAQRWCRLRPQGPASMWSRASPRATLPAGADPAATEQPVKSDEAVGHHQPASLGALAQLAVLVGPGASSGRTSRQGRSRRVFGLSTRMRFICHPRVPGRGRPGRDGLGLELTDTQWAVLEPLLPRGRKPGRPQTWTRRQLIDGIRFRVCTGIPWRDIPRSTGRRAGCTTSSAAGSGTAPGSGSSPRCWPGRMRRT